MKLEHRWNRYQRRAACDNADGTGQKENDDQPEHLNAPVGPRRIRFGRIIAIYESARFESEVLCGSDAVPY
jgi:hypothetical protein